MTGGFLSEHTEEAEYTVCPEGNRTWSANFLKHTRVSKQRNLRKKSQILSNVTKESSFKPMFLKTVGDGLFLGTYLVDSLDRSFWFPMEGSAYFTVSTK